MEIYTYSKADLLLSSKYVESASFAWFSINDKHRYDKEMFLTLDINLPHSWVAKIPRESMLAFTDKYGGLWEPQVLTIDVLKMLTRADKFFKLLWSKGNKNLDSFDPLGRFIITNVFKSYCSIKLVMPINDQIIDALLGYIASAIIQGELDNNILSMNYIVSHIADKHYEKRSLFMADIFNDLISTAYSWTTPFTARDMRICPFHTVLRTASDLWPKYRLNGEICTDKLPPDYYVTPQRSTVTQQISELTHTNRLELFANTHSHKNYHNKVMDEWPIYNCEHPLFESYDYEIIDEDNDDEFDCD